jgi:branched-chain amino acid transport system permease protein
MASLSIVFDRATYNLRSTMDYAGVVTLEILYMIAFLALTSAGLAIVFGMMRVINLAHGEFVLLGGYATLKCSQLGINVYVAMLVIAPLLVGIVGLIVERLIIRFLYGRMIDTMLATWGLSLTLIGLVTLYFGPSAMSIPAPIPGYQLGTYQMGGYNLFIILITTALFVAMWGVLKFTRAGLIARGAMQGPDVVAALGYNPRTVYMVTFTVGAALSGLAGGVLAPLTGLLPSSGGAYIAKAFITVITGGAAVISGTLSSSIIFGTINQLVSFAAHPVIGEIAMLALAIILLRLMPRGITGRFFRDGT